MLASAARRVPRRSARRAATADRDDAALPDALVVHEETGVGEHARAAVRHARRPSPRCDRCPSQCVFDRRTEAEPRGVVVLPVLEPLRAGGELVAIARHEVGAVMIGLRRDAPGRGSIRGRRGSPSRAAHAGTCAPSPTGSRSRSRRRRGRAVRPTGTHRAGTARRPTRASAPISAAGFTSPPFVGTWVSDTSATSPPTQRVGHRRRPTPARIRRSAPARGRPRTPPQRGGRRPCWRRTRGRARGSAAPPPSAPTRTPRSTPPSRSRTGRSRAAGRGADGRSSRPTASRSQRPLGRHLVPAGGRLALQVLDLRVDDRPAAASDAPGVVEMDLIGVRARSPASPRGPARSRRRSTEPGRRRGLTAADRPLRAARSPPPR